MPRISLNALYIHSAPASFFQKMFASLCILINIGGIAFSQSHDILLGDSQEEARRTRSFPLHVRTCQSSRFFHPFPPFSCWTLRRGLGEMLPFPHLLLPEGTEPASHPSPVSVFHASHLCITSGWGSVSRWELVVSSIKRLQKSLYKVLCPS